MALEHRLSPVARCVGLAVLALLAATACGGTVAVAGGTPDGSVDAAPAVDAPLADAPALPDAAALPDAPAGACPSSTAPAPGTVITDRGPITGAMSGATWAYLGIPYAAPPTGALRWQATQAHDCWSAPLATTSFGPLCLQVDPNDTTTVLGDEDCLTANVWTPASATPASKLPVMFFVHGGGNVQGSSADRAPDGTYLYDGAALAAATNTVVVTIDYRLGAMGFLAHPAFGDHPGNYGLDDQIFALGWIARNAAAFGGDPAHLLLFGESAGAVDVCALVASPAAHGRFAAALMESGGCNAEPAATAASFAATFAHTVGCDTASDPAACLRALDARTITLAVPEPADVAGAKQGDYQPVIDGVVLTANPHAVIAAGEHNHVPMVIGGNSMETRRYVPTLANEAAYDAAVLGYAGGNQSLANEIIAEYPLSNYGGDPTDTYAAVTTDAKFVCTVRYDARAAVAGQPELPVYRYFFTHGLENVAPAIKGWGAYHGLELLFVFRHLMISGYVASAGEDALEGAIGGYWSRLATSGDPDGDGAVPWPRYDAVTDPYLGLDDTITPGMGVRTELCDFWDQLLGRD